MKHLFIACLLLIGLSSCKNDVETTQDNTEETVVDSIPTIKGEFIYIADAAVLKGDNFIYGVKIDAKAQELAERVSR